MSEKLKFEDIFKEEGLYRSNSFADGIAFKIEKNSFSGDLCISMVDYDSPDQIIPKEYPLTVYGGLFKKEYTKVLNRNQLFTKK